MDEIPSPGGVLYYKGTIDLVNASVILFLIFSLTAAQLKPLIYVHPKASADGVGI